MARTVQVTMPCPYACAVPCTVSCMTPAVRAECRLNQPGLPIAGLEAAVVPDFAGALEVGVRILVLETVLVH